MKAMKSSICPLCDTRIARFEDIVKERPEQLVEWGYEWNERTPIAEVVACHEECHLTAKNVGEWLANN